MCHPCLSKMVVLHFLKKGRRCLWDDAVCLLINHEGKYIILKLNDCSYSQSLSPPRRNLNLSSRPRLLPQPLSPQPPSPQPPNPLNPNEFSRPNPKIFPPIYFTSLLFLIFFLFYFIFSYSFCILEKMEFLRSECNYLIKYFIKPKYVLYS